MPIVDNVPWDDIEEVHTTAMRGFSPRRGLLKRLAEYDPRYVFGLAHKEVLPQWTAEKWQPMTLEHWGVKSLDEFNKKVATRFEIRVDQPSGYIMHRDNIIMFMSKAYRERLEKKRVTNYEEYWQGNVDQQADHAAAKTGQPVVQESQTKRVSTTDAKEMREFEQGWKPV
jgi:hypothetical protein